MRRPPLLRTAFSLALAFATGLGSSALAGERVSGTVLVVEPDDKILMHHDAFGEMPAMTMEFALPPGAVVHTGDHLDAEADATREPWRLSHVRIVPARTSFAPPGKMIAPLADGDRVPDIAMLDARGRPFSPSDLRGHPYVLSFVYTRCRDARMCPLVSSKLVQVERRTPPRARILEVTLDPEHDRPPVLAAYGRLFGVDPQRFELAVASPIVTATFASRFGILARRTDAATIVHSERLAVVDRSGRIRKLVDNALWDPRDVAAELSAL